LGSFRWWWWWWVWGGQFWRRPVGGGLGIELIALDYVVTLKDVRMLIDEMNLINYAQELAGIFYRFV
jgi:hypothetical protein